MARFDDQFALLTAQLQAALAVIAQYPEVAAEVKTAVEEATPDGITEGQAQDEARANVLSTLIAEVSTALDEAI
jgi:hypothetical protein